MRITGKGFEFEVDGTSSYKYVTLKSDPNYHSEIGSSQTKYYSPKVAGMTVKEYNEHLLKEDGLTEATDKVINLWREGKI